ncbi:MAG: hypothetical protein JWM41_1741 [Gemmatimonadetes bacterium]|nr:hypothetical protein [Gemmatimonadota bacterium]
MRAQLSIALIVATLACHADDAPSANRSASSSVAKFGDAADGSGAGRRSAGFIVTKTSPELRQRADSLAALDPVKEAREAAGRGDFRYLAVCGTACVPIGLAADTVCLLQGCASVRPEETHPIAGMEMPVMNADVARLDSVAGRYGARYNHVIREYRNKRLARRPIS